MRDKTHSEQIERWAVKCRDNMNECKKEVNAFIDAQIEKANKFYENLPNEKLDEIKKLRK